jgi:hypothetical protein
MRRQMAMFTALAFKTYYMGAIDDRQKFEEEEVLHLPLFIPSAPPRYIIIAIANLLPPHFLFFLLPIRL